MFANIEHPTSIARRNRGDARGDVAARQAETPEWTPYRIRIPEATRRRSRDGIILETVHHVVHVPTARRILEDNRLRAGLIYDESRLNRSRMCVTWVSANTWGPGSIYGNVQFSFAWSDLIRDRRVYWVEAMPDYSPRAYRLLLTDRDLSASRHVTPYDPASDEGPLRERDGVWYWNGNYTSEFMIDADLPLHRLRVHQPQTRSLSPQWFVLYRPNGASLPNRWSGFGIPAGQRSPRCGPRTQDARDAAARPAADRCSRRENRRNHARFGK